MQVFMRIRSLFLPSLLVAISLYTLQSTAMDDHLHPGIFRRRGSNDSVKFAPAKEPDGDIITQELKEQRARGLSRSLSSPGGLSKPKPQPTESTFDSLATEITNPSTNERSPHGKAKSPILSPTGTFDKTRKTVSSPGLLVSPKNSPKLGLEETNKPVTVIRRPITQAIPAGLPNQTIGAAEPSASGSEQHQ
jgi:hypothetical protein